MKVRAQVTYHPGNHVQDEVELDTEQYDFDTLLDQWYLYYKEHHARLQILFDLELSVNVNGTSVKNEDDWTQVLAQHHDPTALLPITVVVALRDKPAAASDYVEEQLQAYRLSQLDSNNLYKHQINEALQADWFDAMVDRMLDTNEHQQSEEIAEEKSLLNDVMAEMIDPEVLIRMTRHSEDDDDHQL